jgi:NADPH:quinone reductase
MRAAVILDGAVTVETRPDPVPGFGQILIRVRAAGVNNADVVQREGRYPAPPDCPADIPGLECAGDVVACGPATGRYKEGDRVMALLGGGAYAELVAVHERQAMPVPANIDWTAAGGFVEAFATAHDALFTQAGLQLGERLLVTGAAGGVGVAAVQLGREAGARVTASSRREEHQARLRAFGADTDVDGRYDVILELVGGDLFARDIELLAAGGRISVIGMSAGDTSRIDLRALMFKRARVSGSTLRGRPAEEKALVVQRLAHHALPLLGAGRLVVPVDRTFPLDAAGAALDAFTAGGKFGKIVIVPG